MPPLYIELARLANGNVQTLRFYERKGWQAAMTQELSARVRILDQLFAAV